MKIIYHRKLFIWATITLFFVFILGSKTYAVTETKIVPSDGAPGDNFGMLVSISGDVLLVGAYLDDDNGADSGSAYVFRWNGSSWVEEQKLLASDGAAGDFFGRCVSISGDVAYVAAIHDNDNGTESGSAYIFRWNGVSWVEEQKLTASDGAAGDNFGRYSSLNGDLAIIGATLDDDNGNRSGSAYVFRYNGVSWVEEQKLTASDGAAYDQFGYGPYISGDVAIVGAPFDDDNATDSGSAYVFRWNGVSWVEEQKLTASDGAASDEFGNRGFISGDWLLVNGLSTDSKGTNSGSAYVFRWNGVSWVEEQKLLASDGAAGDHFGSSPSFSGNLAVIGAYDDDDNGTDSGSAYVFRWNGSSWVEEQKLIASDGAAGDNFGHVFISGDVVVVGAPLDDDNGNESGSAYVYDLNPQSNPPPNGDGGCFIATAAYGSAIEPHVKILREFRDRFLLTNYLGNRFVDFYYTQSPPMADFIAKHESLRSVVRWGLLPFVGISWFSLKIGSATTLVLLLSLFSLISAATLVFYKKIRLRS